jgi:hypothetical protein
MRKWIYWKLHIVKIEDKKHRNSAISFEKDNLSKQYRVKKIPIKWIIDKSKKSQYNRILIFGFNYWE